MNNTATAQSAQNGAFIVQCETHCEALGGGWASFEVGGVSMRDAVAAWMSDPAPAPQRHFHFDAMLDGAATPRKTNPTC
jgi:hypothetical protein